MRTALVLLAALFTLLVGCGSPDTFTCTCIWDYGGREDWYAAEFKCGSTPLSETQSWLDAGVEEGLADGAQAVECACFQDLCGLAPE